MLRALSRLAVITAVLGAGLSCIAGDSVVVQGRRLRVSRDVHGVVLTNLTDRPTAFLAIDAETSVGYQQTRCLSADPSCLRIPARQSLFVPADSIVGYTQGRTIWVYIFSWQVRQNLSGTGFWIDEDQPVSISLREDDPIAITPP